MLNEILKKLGVKSIDDLKPAERETYRQWGQVLAKADVTVDNLKKLLPAELDRANAELRKHENSHDRDLFYKAYAELLTNLTRIIVTPAQERDQLRAFLKQKFGI